MSRLEDGVLTAEWPDVDAGWNGDVTAPWVDITVHDDFKPDDEPTIVARISLTYDETKDLIAVLESALDGIDQNRLAELHPGV
jgi:hypothetical protein